MMTSTQKTEGRVKLGTAVLLFHDCYKCLC